MRSTCTLNARCALVGVNVVIGVLVVHCELLIVVRVHVPLVVSDDAVVGPTLGLIALLVLLFSS